MFKSNVSKVLLFLLFVPTAVMPMLENSMENVDRLIKQEKYDSAAAIMMDILDENLSQAEQEYALEFAIDKVKHLASLDKEKETESYENYIEFPLEDLTKCVIGHLSRKKSLAEAISFTKDFLASFSHKWVFVSMAMIVELFHQDPRPSLDLLSNLVDEYLLPTSEQKFDVFMESYCQYHLLVSYVLGIYLQPNNLVGFQTSGDGDLGAAKLGKKYVDYYLDHGHEVSRKQITENYHVLRAKAEESDSDFVMDEVCTKDKEQFIKYFLELEAGAIASLALSTSLFMKKEDAIVYIREAYSRLIRAGYERIAEGLKLYCTNQPLNKDADRDFFKRYFISTPELVIIPEHLVKALATRS